MTKRTWIVTAFIACAAAGLLAWSLRPQSVIVEQRAVEKGTFELTVEEEGRTRVRERYTISSPAAGKIDRLLLKSGDLVRAGDVIALLRPAPPSLQDSRLRAELREKLGAAQAAVERADANVGRAAAALEQSRFDANRARTLAAQGFVSKSADDQARLALAQQEQALRAAESDRHASGHQLDEARAALAQTERAATSGAAIAIRAPTAGRLLRVMQESEAVVAAGTPLADVGDPGSLEAIIEVLSQDATRIRPGMPVRMRAAPAAPAIAGHVRTVEPGARTKVSTLGIEEQRVSVVADFDAPPAGLGDGFHLDTGIVVLAQDDVLLIPVGALFRQGEHWAVFAVHEGRAHLRRVELGGRNGRLAWVARGLDPAEVVIVYPPGNVRDGTPVRGH